jgi:hypothetical protein
MDCRKYFPGESTAILINLFKLLLGDGLDKVLLGEVWWFDPVKRGGLDATLEFDALNESSCFLESRPSFRTAMVKISFKNKPRKPLTI